MTVRTWGLKWSSRKKTKKLHLWEILQTQQVPWAIPWYFWHKKTENFRKHAWNHHEFWGDTVTPPHNKQKNNSSTTMTKIQSLNYVKNILGRIREVYSKNIKLWIPKKNGSVKGQLVGDPIIFPSSYHPKPRPEGFRSDGLASVFILGRPGEQSYLAVRIGPMSRVYLSKISIISIYVQYLSI